MGRIRALFGSSGVPKHSPCPRLAFHQPPRECATHALRGRASGRTASAWALSGPLAWRDSRKGDQDNAAPDSPSSASTTIPPQPILDAGSTVAGGSTAGRSSVRGPALPGTAARESAATHALRSSTLQASAPPTTTPGVQPQSPQDRAPQPPPSDTDTVLTFSYGANMNFLTLARREVRVLSRDAAYVAEPGVRLVFKHQGGYATLEREGEAGGRGGAEQEEPRFRPYDGRVHGVLYRLTRKDFERLSKREGGYLVQQLQVRTYDGAVHSALVFVSNPLFKLPAEVTPTEAYLSKLREGAADNYLDPAYQAFLSGITTVPAAGLGSEYYNTPSKYMGYSFLVVAALITLAFFVQH